MTDHSAVRRRYLLEIARRLRGPDAEQIKARARGVIAKWEAVGIRPVYVTMWRQILIEGADEVERVARSMSPDAIELQHCMPFAGILDNRARLELRRGH